MLKFALAKGKNWSTVSYSVSNKIHNLLNSEEEHNFLQLIILPKFDFVVMTTSTYKLHSPRDLNHLLVSFKMTLL